jgi:hypothetical protein
VGAEKSRTSVSLVVKAVVAWFALFVVMFTNGIARVLVLQPRLGEHRARQPARGCRERLGRCLDQPHLMAASGEGERLPQAGDPGADDENLRHILPFGSRVYTATIRSARTACVNAIGRGAGLQKPWKSRRP